MIPLGAFITFLFLVLKLTDQVDWNWFWVFSPLIFAVIISVVASAYVLRTIKKMFDEF